MWLNVRQFMAKVSDTFWMASGFIALLPYGILLKLFPGSGMGAAFSAWVLGFLVMIPLTGPLALIAFILDKVFSLEALRKETKSELKTV